MKPLMIKTTILALSVSLFGFSNNPEAQQYRKVNHHAFQVGEKLTYRLHYGFIDAGEASIEVKETDKKIYGRKLLRLVGIGKTVSTFDWFFKVRDRYESYIDAEGIFPWVFIRRVNEGGFKIEQDYTFYQHKNQVQIDDEKKIDAPESVQDMISAFYYARTLDFRNAKEGQEFTIPTFVDGKTYDLKIKFLGREDIKTRSGKFKAMKFCPVVQTGRIWKKEDDMTVWISDDENKIPLLAKSKIAVGSIKMELTDYTGLANDMAEVK